MPAALAEGDRSGVGLLPLPGTTSPQLLPSLSASSLSHYPNRNLCLPPLVRPQVIEGRKEMDWTRHAVFCTFGFAYLGGFQYWLYNIQFTKVREVTWRVRERSGCVSV